MTCRAYASAAAFAIALANLGSPTAAHADDTKGKTAVVAVLPLVSASKDLEIYGGPVARAVVTSLSKKLSMRVEAVSLSGAIPSHLTLVIDGRIIARGKSKVMLTATVRDPTRGTREGTVSTRVRAVTEIDKLASELASLLSPVVKSAAKRSLLDEVPQETNGNTGIKPVTDLSGDNQQDPVDATLQPTPDDRPIVVVVPPNGSVGGAVNVGPSSYAPMVAAVNRLGFAAVRSTRSGIVGPSDIASEISSASGEYALMIEVKKVEFEWGGVLSARGKVRVLLVDRQGRVMHDRTLRTDTLVGSRGDRHAALIGFVAEQAIDIAYPALRRAMR